MKKRKINFKRLVVAGGVWLFISFVLASLVGSLFTGQNSKASESLKYEYSFTHEAAASIVKQVRETGSATRLSCGEYTADEMKAGVNEVLHSYGQNMNYQLGENSYIARFGNFDITNEGLRNTIVEAVSEGDDYQLQYNKLVKEVADKVTRSSLLTYLEKNYSLNEDVTFRELITEHEARAEDMAKFISDICQEKGMTSKYNKNGVWIDDGIYTPLNEIFDI